MSILAIIIEKVSGLDYEKYLQTNLFEPIGIKKIGYRYPLTKEDTIAIGYQNGNIWGTHQSHFEKVGGGPYWNLKGNGGLEVSLDEMYLWLNSFNNNTILKKESIEKMFTAHTQEEGYNGESFFGYGCNISKSRRNTKMIDNGGSNGIYFARIVRLPGEGVVFFMITNESTINTSMVLPNITQLYFMGKIEQDALTMNPKFENELSKKVYEIVDRSPEVKLEEELAKAKLVIDDDMILLEVGQKLMQEDKPLKALNLYKYYTKMFPKIVVAWNDMGDIYLSEDNKEEAIKCYKQALKIKPENPRAKESLSKLDK
ncbi:MAG: serine hydrolase [Sphingobacteriaceae bacterium]|nr:serine hydrolase [Sphingobacteriaceae bacterium]